jgi:hypothetical protein
MRKRSSSIEVIEKLTQLTFMGTKGASQMSLSAFDPLKERHTSPRLADCSAVARRVKSRLD